MNNKEYLNESELNNKVYARESLIMNVTEDILVAMEDKAVTKTDLARLLDRSKPFVTQILSGSRNMTLGTLSDIAFDLDLGVSIIFKNKKESVAGTINSSIKEWDKSESVVTCIKTRKKLVTNATISNDGKWHSPEEIIKIA